MLSAKPASSAVERLVVAASVGVAIAVSARAVSALAAMIAATMVVGGNLGVARAGIFASARVGRLGLLPATEKLAKAGLIAVCVPCVVAVVVVSVLVSNSI